MIPIAEGLFTRETPPRLLGGRDLEGRLTFPCPAGAEPVPLARRGTVWSYTVQRFRPKSPPYIGPDVFEPFVVAYVELAGETIVEARLTGIEPGAVHIGLTVEFAPAPLDTCDGPRLIPAFAPLP